MYDMYDNNNNECVFPLSNAKGEKLLLNFETCWRL